MTSGPIQLKGISAGSDMRHFLLGAEAWQGLTFLGVVSVEWFAAALRERLDLLQNLDALRGELAADPARRLGPPLEDTRPLALPAPAYIPIPKSLRVKRRRQRQKNKGRRRPQ